jgi:hypothetical protein
MTPSYPVALLDADDFLTTYPRGYDRAPLAKPHVQRAVSHLETLRAWLDTNEPEAIFYEGEAWEKRAFAWPWTWEEVRAHVPHTFDVFQMHVAYDPRATPEVRMHRRVNERSVNCYLITRGYVEKLMRLYRVGRQYDLTRVYPRACAEEVIYDGGVVYTMPLVNIRVPHSTNTSFIQKTHTQSEHTLEQIISEHTLEQIISEHTLEQIISEHTLEQIISEHTHTPDTLEDLIELFWRHIGDVHDPYDLF